MMLKQNTKQWYLIGASLGVLVGALLYFVQPVKWKGQALIRIGQLSQNLSQNNSSIEPLPVVVERIKSRAFIQAVAERAKKNEIMAMLNVDEGAGLSVKPTRNSDALQIVVVGNSAELVRASIDGVAAEIISKHDDLLKNYIADSIKELSTIESEINALSKRISLADEKLSRENGSIAGLVIIATQPALEFKLNRASILREGVSSTNIRRTVLVENPSITERRLFSSLWRACLFGALVGILLSTLWVQWKK